MPRLERVERYVPPRTPHPLPFFDTPAVEEAAKAIPIAVEDCTYTYAGGYGRCDYWDVLIRNPLNDESLIVSVRVSWARRVWSFGYAVFANTPLLDLPRVINGDRVPADIGRHVETPGIERTRREFDKRVQFFNEHTSPVPPSIAYVTSTLAARCKRVEDANGNQDTYNTAWSFAWSGRDFRAITREGRELLSIARTADFDTVAALRVAGIDPRKVIRAAHEGNAS